MKILIDIGHPAHVHYFKNFIKIMREKGHEFLIIAKKRNIVPALLKEYNINYSLRKDFPKDILGKLFNILHADILVLKRALKFKPDILIGFSGTHISHVGRIIQKPSIVFDDTEHASLAHASYKHFASCILTPTCFTKSFGKKHLRFNSYMELCYLHPEYFKVPVEIKSSYSKKKCLIRFVAWKASHDLGEKGLNNQQKIRLVSSLSKYYDVYISSEGRIPTELIKYQITISPEKIHHFLASVDLFIGEGATMASECAILGTPAIYLNVLELGYLTEQDEKYGLVYNIRSYDRAVEKAIELIQNTNIKKIQKEKRLRLVQEKINPTTFMVWFVENYPQSFNIIKKNPDYQKNFK